MAHGSYQEQIDHQVTISWAEFDEWRNFSRIQEVCFTKWKEIQKSVAKPLGIGWSRVYLGARIQW